MKNLVDLLRQVFYHAFRVPGQVRGATATAALVLAAVLSSDQHIELLVRIEHLLRFMIYLIGSAVVLNIVLRHGNELLERLITEQHSTEHETHRLIEAIKTLLGWPPKK
jgi:hypothetical protein